MCQARIHDTVDKAFGWKVLLCEIIWRLQVQSQQQTRIANKTFSNLTQSTPMVQIMGLV